MNETTGVPRAHVSLARYLVRRGHEVHVVGDPRTSDARLVDGAVFHPVLTGALRQTRLGYPRYVIAFARRASALVQQERTRFDVVHVRGECCLTPDVYHVTGIQWGERRRRLETQPRAGLGRHAKDALYPFARPLHPVLATLERQMLRSPSLARITAESWFVADDLVSHYGVARERIEVIPPSVDVSSFHPGPGRNELRAASGLPAETPLVLFVGDDFERKGLDRAIGALTRMREPAHLVVVGGGTHQSSGWEADSLEHFRRVATQAGVHDRVHFLGRRGDVADILRAVDVLVHPSYTDMWATVVVEAMASGVPPVVSAATGASGAITDGVDGFVLSEPLDIGELAHRLDLLCGSADLRAEMGERAVEAGRRWSATALHSRVEQILRDTVASARA